MPNNKKQQSNQHNKDRNMSPRSKGSQAAGANNNKHKNNTYRNAAKAKGISFYLIPILFILCIVPFVVRLAVYNPGLSNYSWFPEVTSQADFFLYYKQWLFIAASFIMVCIIAIRAYMDKRVITFLPVFIPLAAYAGLCFLSAVFSKHRSLSFLGGLEQFESVFALLGYCLVVYYVFLFVKTERDIKVIFIFLLTAVIIMGILMLFQFLGYDFYKSDLAAKLMIPEKYRSGEVAEFNFEKGRVYGPMYNPNYVGSYAALLLPIFTVLLFFQKKWYMIVLHLLAITGLIFAIIGSQSLTGIIGLAVSVFVFLVLMRRYIVKFFYITIPAILIVGLLILYANNKTDGVMVHRIMSLGNIARTEYPLSSIETGDDSVSLNYLGNEMRVSYHVDENNNRSFTLTDTDGNVISFQNENGMLNSMDSRLPGFVIGPDPQYIDVFYITVDGMQWRFVNNAQEHTYYYINSVGKPDKMINAPSAVFTGYERLASGRGYLWSRTIPLLKKYILLGAGPDNFVTAFPQQDYLRAIQVGYQGLITTKPHNMYLQIAVQTGMVSLIAFLVFYGMYFVTSLRLYIKGRFKSYYAQVGVAVFLGTIAYMITGLANDSTITTAPIFWTMMGIGILANHKAKQVIISEEEQLG